MSQRSTRVYPVGSAARTRLVVAGALMLALAVSLFGTAPRALAAPPWCTPERGQALIDAGEYESAVRSFTCVIETVPTGVEGYRGRAEAELLLGRYSDAMHDYTRVTAVVLPIDPDALDAIFAGYAERLAVEPTDIPSLTGASFARWYDFQYPAALHLLERLLDEAPDDRYGTLFRGSTRILKGVNSAAKGVADLERAIALDPANPHVHWVVADAYTYGLSDPERAFAEAMLAYEGGLHTPRVHALLASAYNAFGDLLPAALHIAEHIDLVTTELLTAAALIPDTTLSLDLVPGRTYEIPVPAVAGERISIATSSRDYWDTIAVLLAPDGSPVVGSDDTNVYFAAFDWVAAETGTYRMQVTFFESVNTGTLVVTRD
jgi:tetratricopeptide (TPR) repeat protein